jgi:hypothetical protein
MVLQGGALAQRWPVPGLATFTGFRDGAQPFVPGASQLQFALKWQTR